jgi:hypothetical protein
MPARKSKSSTKSKGNGATLGFEQQLWEMADRMRGFMDPAEYKHVALGLIFLKYISDAFQAAHDKVAADPHAIRKTAMNTQRTMSSGFRARRGGRKSRPARVSLTSAISSTRRCSQSRRKTPVSKASCRANTAGPA